MFKTLSYFIFRNFLNFKASRKSFMILRHKSTMSISSSQLNNIRKKYLINFGDVWHCHNENSLSNATLCNKWHQSKKGIAVVIPFFPFKIKFFLLKVVLSLQEMALQKKRKLINRSLTMQCTFNTAGIKISQEIIDNLRSMIVLQIQESWTWIDGNRIKWSIQIKSRP